MKVLQKSSGPIENKIEFCSSQSNKTAKNKSLNDYLKVNDKYGCQVSSMLVCDLIHDLTDLKHLDSD